MFSGTQTRDLVVQHLNSIGNAINLEWNAQAMHDVIEWAIQASEDDNKVRI